MLQRNRATVLTGVLGLAAIYTWSTQTFGTAIWVLLGALVLRYLLFLGGQEASNPFESFLVYVGSLVASQYAASGGVLSGEALKGLVLLAAVYELKAVARDMPAITTWLSKRAAPADQAAMQQQMQSLQQTVLQLAQQLGQQPKADAAPGQGQVPGGAASGGQNPPPGP